MIRRALFAVAREVPASASAAFGPAVALAGFVLGLWLVWFTPVGPLLAGAL